MPKYAGNERFKGTLFSCCQIFSNFKNRLNSGKVMKGNVFDFGERNLLPFWCADWGADWSASFVTTTMSHDKGAITKCGYL